jgi:hypothetical protein
MEANSGGHSRSAIAVAAAIAAALLLAPAPASAAQRPTIMGRPRLLGADLAKLKRHLDVLAFASYDNPFVDNHGHSVARGDVTDTAQLKLELFTRRGHDKPRLVKIFTTSGVDFDRPDLGRARTTHRFVLDPRTVSRVNQARSAHRKILYRLTLRQLLKHHSSRPPRRGESTVAHTAEAELKSPVGSGPGTIARMYSDGTFTLYVGPSLNHSGGATQAVTEIESISTADPSVLTCMGAESSLDAGQYIAVNQIGAPISQNGSFQLQDSQGDLSRWNRQRPTSGWMIAPANAAPLNQAAGHGVPGASGTFSADGSTVTLTFPITTQEFITQPSGLVQCDAPAPQTLLKM